MTGSINVLAVANPHRMVISGEAGFCAEKPKLFHWIQGLSAVNSAFSHVWLHVIVLGMLAKSPRVCF